MKNDKLSKAIGGSIRELRTKSELSQDEFGAMVNADRTYICKIENGSKNLTICKLCEICENAGITLREFFSDEKFSEKYFKERQGV